jgi:hypothetical protein
MIRGKQNPSKKVMTSFKKCQKRTRSKNMKKHNYLRKFFKTNKGKEEIELDK